MFNQELLSHLQGYPSGNANDDTKGSANGTMSHHLRQHQQNGDHTTAGNNNRIMGMNPYHPALGNSHASIANAYAMQAQSGMAGAFPHFSSNSQREFQAAQPTSNAASLFMMNNNASNNASNHAQSQQQQQQQHQHQQQQHHYLTGLTGAMPFTTSMMMYEDANAGSIQKQQVVLPSAESTQDNSPATKPAKTKEANKKKRKKKPKDCPRRPLSAYNLFFKDERKRILEAIPAEEEDDNTPKDPKDEITWPGKKRTPHGKIGFESLAKTIGARWKQIEGEEMKHYKDLATQDLRRYANQMKEYEAKLSSGQIKEPDDDEDEDEDQEVPTKSKKKASKKRASDTNEGSLVSNTTNPKKARAVGATFGRGDAPPYMSMHDGTSAGTSSALRSAAGMIDPAISFHQHLQQGTNHNNNLNNIFARGGADQEQLMHLHKL